MNKETNYWGNEKYWENVEWGLTSSIFDTEQLIKGYNNSDSKLVVLYFIVIILYIINFVYLFKRDHSEYIAYVFVFIVNGIFPMIWIKDFHDFIANANFGSTLVESLMKYREWSVYTALFLQFIALFLVVIKNENVRVMKKMNKAHNDGLMRSEKNTLTTQSKTTEHYDKIILIFFVTITTTVLSLIGDTFTYPVDSAYDTNLIQVIRWLMGQPEQFANNIDSSIHYILNMIKTTPLVKSFGVYCVVFICVFFGAFIRIPQQAHRNPNRVKSIARFKIINMTNPFPAVFERKLDTYRILTLVFFCIFISIVLFGILGLLMAFMKLPAMFAQGVFVLGSILFFGCFLGKRYDVLPTSYSIKKMAFFLLSVVFALLGTPTVLAILQLFAEIGIFNFFTSLFNNDNSITTAYSTLNTNNVLGGAFIIIFLTLLITMNELGVTRGWFDNSNGAPMRMFIVILVCMAISLFTALIVKYPMFTYLYKFLFGIARNTQLFIAPLAIIVFAIVQLIFAAKNNNKYKKYEKISRRVIKNSEKDSGSVKKPSFFEEIKNWISDRVKNV
jgi:hypothetical protein